MEPAIHELIDLAADTARFNRRILLPAVTGGRSLPGCRDLGPAEGLYEVTLVLADGPVTPSGMLDEERHRFLEPLLGEVTGLLRTGGTGVATLHADRAREVAGAVTGVRVLKRDDGPIPLRPLSAVVPPEYANSTGHGAYGRHYDPASGACIAIIDALKPADAERQLAPTAPKGLTVDWGDVQRESGADGRQSRTRRPFRLWGQVSVSARSYTRGLGVLGSPSARYFVVAEGELVWTDDGALVQPAELPEPGSSWVQLQARTREQGGGTPTLRRLDLLLEDAVSYLLSAAQQARMIERMRLPKAAERAPSTLAIPVPSRADLPER